ncbi:hypothetical protein EYF80_007645 [Liparis tanakae]|uniref:Uncharacterized protein n=1 Tax=Liparis tanakae TaxID=230148 RepID=A0A4Z2IVH2_9TELE|nr:hypothetical protein EYF80_007645 [Liparis tanakae]
MENVPGVFWLIAPASPSRQHTILPADFRFTRTLNPTDSGCGTPSPIHNRGARIASRKGNQGQGEDTDESEKCRDALERYPPLSQSFEFRHYKAQVEGINTISTAPKTSPLVSECFEVKRLKGGETCRIGMMGLRGLYGSSSTGAPLGYGPQKLCIWIVSSAQRGSTLKPPHKAAHADKEPICLIELWRVWPCGRDCNVAVILPELQGAALWTRNVAGKSRSTGGGEERGVA